MNQTGTPPKILVIEDNVALQQSVLEILTLEGFQAVGAENGFEGLRLAREIRPDLIICDIMMPGLDGFGVLEELRQDPKMAMIPFVFLTARADRAAMRHGMELGAYDYLTKPFSAQEMFAAIRAQLEKAAVFADDAERRMNELRNQLTLSLPHELRTPLTVILGFSEILLEDGPNAPPQQIMEMMGSINQAAKRLYRLVENYLVYVQLEISRTKPEWVIALRAYNTPNPHQVVRDYAETAATAVNRLNDLNLSLSPTQAPLAMGEEYLGRIVNELVSNACKFSEPGTPIHVSAEERGGTFYLSVRDFGRGMSADQIAAIGAYMQFERLRYEQQGSGFGLIITLRLAELHGGSFSIESTPGEGLLARVALPMRER
jgi:signal transduction histidine kinase